MDLNLNGFTLPPQTVDGINDILDFLVTSKQSLSAAQVTAYFEKLDAAAAAAAVFNAEDAAVNATATQLATITLNAALTKNITILGSPSKFLTSGGRRAANTSSNRAYFPVASTAPAAGNLTAILLEGNNDYNSWGWSASVSTESSKIAFQVFGFTTKFFRVLVDGQYINKTYTAFAADSVLSYIEVDFAGVYKQRTITIECSTQTGIYGVWVEATADISAPTPANPITALIASDSYGEGQGATQPGHGSFSQMLGKRLGWTDVRQVSVGSTGYLVDASGLRSRLRLQIPRWLTVNSDLTPSTVDVIMLAHGYNDWTLVNAATATAAQVGAEAAACAQLIRVTFPNALIIVLGPWAGIRNGDANTLAIENAIFASVGSLNDPRLRLIPVSTDLSPWQYGTGRVGATNGTGNTDRGIAADGVHPSDQGHGVIAVRAANSIRKALAAT